MMIKILSSSKNLCNKRKNQRSNKRSLPVLNPDRLMKEKNLKVSLVKNKERDLKEVEEAEEAKEAVIEVEEKEEDIEVAEEKEEKEKKDTEEEEVEDHTEEEETVKAEDVAEDIKER